MSNRALGHVFFTQKSYRDMDRAKFYRSDSIRIFHPSSCVYCTLYSIVFRTYLLRETNSYERKFQLIMPSINQTSLSIYTISPFCKSVISPSIHTWYQIEKKPPNLFSCYYYSVRELLGDFFPCCCKDFFPHHQQPRLREFSGTVSPDFRPFLATTKLCMGPL